MLLAKPGKLEPLAGEVAHFQRNHAPGGTPVSLDMPVPLRPEHQVEGFAAIGQRLHGEGQLLGRCRVEPFLEAQEAIRVARHAEPMRKIGDMHARSILRGPGEQNLRLGGEDRLEYAFARPIALGLERRRVAGFQRGLRRPQAGERAADGEGNDAKRDAEREEDAGVVHPAQRDQGIGRAGWGGQRRRRGAPTAGEAQAAASHAP